jgi:hypothetical protein
MQQSTLLLISLIACILFVGMTLLGILKPSPISWWQCMDCSHWFSSAGDRQKDEPEDWDGCVSHGCCPVCRETVRKEKFEAYKRQLSKF